MYEPMVTNTFEEAGQWLTQTTNRAWTTKQVLDIVIKTCDQTAQFPLQNLTCLRVVPPKNTVFGLYKRDPESYEICFHRLTLDCHFQLSESAAQSLFDYKETKVSVVRTALTRDEPHVVIEPRGESLNVTTDMVRISAGALKALAQAYLQGARLLPIRQDDYTHDWNDSKDVRKMTAYAFLAVVAQAYNWDTFTSRPLILESLEPIEKWDGSLLGRLKKGPPPHAAIPVSQPQAAPASAPILQLNTKDVSIELSGLSKRAKQVNAILEAIKTLKLKPLEIPTGEKNNIRKCCKDKYSLLFGAGNDPFKEAWQVGVNEKKFRMKDHDNFTA
jgi:hypothetical protein